MMAENDNKAGMETAAGGVSISIVICTYGRADSIVVALRSILAADPEFTQVIVVDQNEDLNTYQALSPLLTDERLKYLRASDKGLGRARNIGMEQAQSTIVAFTDDDCEVHRDWLADYRRVFAAYPEVDLCYGSVRAAEHDRLLGYIPNYTLSADRYVRTLGAKLTARGIGANFAVRRGAVQAMGGFDARMGAGGDLNSAEDRDLTLRCLLSGRGVYECCRSVVVHHGFRDWASGRAHTWKDWFGLGAVYVKPLRAGEWRALPYLLHEFVRYALLPFFAATLTFKSQRGWTRIAGFVAGFLYGWNAPLNRQSLCYLPLASEQALLRDEQAAQSRY